MRPHQRVFARRVNQGLRPTMIPAWLAPISLSAAEEDDIRAGGDGLADRRLMRQAKLLQVEQRSCAEVVDQESMPRACASSASSASGTSLVKPTTR